MEVKGILGVFYRVSVWITRFSATNLMWILFNLPITYLALHLLFIEKFSELIGIMIAIVILAPFVFFPATTAMFGIIRKWVMDEEVKLIQYFWKYYKENYVRSMLGGIILVIIWSILAVNYYIYLHINLSSLFTYFYIAIAFVLVICTTHFFSVTVHMNVSLLITFRNAILFTFGKPLLTLQMGITTGLIIYLSFDVITFLIPFFMGSLIAFFAFAGFYRMTLKLQPELIENH